MVSRDRLGKILVKMGYVSEQQIDEAMKLQHREVIDQTLPESLRREILIALDREEVRDKSKISIGDILLKLGLITDEQLNQALKAQKEAVAEVESLEARKLAQIIELGAIVNSTLNISKVLKNIMDLSNGVTDAVASTLMLQDQETGELVFSVPTGPKSDELTDIRIPPGTGIAGWVAENNKALLIPDVTKDERFFGGIDEMIGFKTESILCVPLSAKGKMIGVLEAINKEDGSRFTKEDELLLGIFASQAAMAIENARLYSEKNLHLDDLREQQRVLKASEFRCRVVSEMTTDFSFCFKRQPDQSFRQEWVTDAFKTIIGIAPEKLTRVRDLIGVFHPKDRDEIRNHFRQLEQGIPFTGEYRIRGRSGKTLWLSISCHPLFNEDQGEVERVVGAAREITDQVLAQEENKRLEHLLRQSQKMEALGTLTGGIAHDFNNILQTISGSVQLLSLNQDPVDRTKYIGQIEAASQRASDLIKRLLTFSRDMKPNLVSLDLNHEIRQVTALLERTIPKMIDLECQLAEDLDPIMGDPNQLHQLVLNLASNARDALPEGGVLTIQTENLAPDQARPDPSAEREPCNWVRLSVADDGIGMDEETRRKAFEPFYTTKEVGKGTGLGLSSVYGIVQGHGGRIDCRSQPGAGTIFVIEIPVCEGVPEQDRPAKTAVEEEPQGGEKETVLVVDDEPMVIEIVRDILGQSGFRVQTASSGEEALSVYETLGESIDAVLLDLNMPGMGGRKTLELLLQQNPEAKVIIASGYTITDRDDEQVGPGAKGIINKPYRLIDLLRELRRVLDED